MPLDLKGLFQKGSAVLVEKIGNAFDQNFQNKEEREAAKLALQQEINRNMEALIADATKQVEMENADRADAREMNAKIQEAENASWMSKNVAYIIDLSLLAIFYVMLTIIIFKAVPESNKELFYTAFGALVSYVGTCITFHRGTSKGSEDKGKVIERMKTRGGPAQ